MARLNIETKLWSDPRFQTLMILVGDRQKAKGMVLELWTLAQEHWFPNRALIPENVFSDLGLDAVIQAGLAERREGGVYARGSEEHFCWLFDRQDAGRRGGLASAKARKQAHEPRVKQSQATLKQHSSKTKQIEPSSSFSFSISKDIKTKECADRALQVSDESTQALEQLKPTTKGSRFSPETRAKMGQFYAAYARAYKVRYGSEPEHLRADKALIGKVGYWLEGVSIERATNLVEVFLQIEHRPFTDNFHNLWEFFRHLNRISHALSTGQNPDAVNWSKVFAGGAA